MKNHILLLIIAVVAVVAAIAISGCMGNDDDTVTDIDQDETQG